MIVTKIVTSTAIGAALSAMLSAATLDWSHTSSMMQNNPASEGSLLSTHNKTHTFFLGEASDYNGKMAPTTTTTDFDPTSGFLTIATRGIAVPTKNPSNIPNDVSARDNLERRSNPSAPSPGLEAREEQDDEAQCEYFPKLFHAHLEITNIKPLAYKVEELKSQLKDFVHECGSPTSYKFETECGGPSWASFDLSHTFWPGCVERMFKVGTGQDLASCKRNFKDLGMSFVPGLGIWSNFVDHQGKIKGVRESC